MPGFKVLLVLVGGILPLNEAFSSSDYSAFVHHRTPPSRTTAVFYHAGSRDATKRRLIGDTQHVIRLKKKSRSGSWRRRILFWRRGSQHYTPHSENYHQLSMNLAQDEDVSLFNEGLSPDQQFILQGYESSTPTMLFDDMESELNNMDMHTPMISSEPVAMVSRKTKRGLRGTKRQLKRRKGKRRAKLVKQMMKSQRDSTFQAAGHAFVARIARKWIENFLKGFISNHLVETPDNLTIQCLPQGNVLARLFRGYLKCDARADFRRLVFSGIRLSSGSLEARRMGLNVLAFRRRQQQQAKSSRQRTPRYKNQFDFHADNCVFTRDDLLGSPCIRNGLQNLLVRILRNKGIEPSICTVRVKSIDILSNGKIACSGAAYTIFGTTLPFEVRSAIETSARGHVVTFPGLEISIGSSALGLMDFPIKIPTVDLDIGHNAKLREVKIDGDKKTLTISASTTITPLHTIKLSSYSQSSESYSSLFSVDVGRWLTQLGNFAT